ncbi:hypothetical protein UFOVP597_54 [uncultured Caudovirales phage]|uniref:Uncharacterized protein n=1 Tax=uncultured Caudovirales phage TaxID=2100421 RepID=A0A6J5N0K9_9CAUD|nr:hypothetical protein UFOVP597_54 [uncultured Caudovirales phage]
MLEKYYRLIEEIPLFNWVKINEGKMIYILKDTDSEYTDTEIEEAWSDLFDDYLIKRGLGKSYKKLLEVMKKKMILECDYIISGDEFKKTQIEVEIQNLEMLTKKEVNDMSVEKSLIFLSKWIGYRLDWKIITLNEYYIILEEYGKAN